MEGEVVDEVVVAVAICRLPPLLLPIMPPPPPDMCMWVGSRGSDSDAAAACG